MLPDSFPETFPLPDDAEVTGSYGVVDEDGASGVNVTLRLEDGASGVNVTLRLEDGVDEVVAFYEAALPDAGWEIVATLGRGEPILLRTLEVAGHGYEGRIRVEARDEEVSALLLPQSEP